MFIHTRQTELHILYIKLQYLYIYLLATYSKIFMPKLSPLAVVIAELSVFIHTKAKKLYSLIDVDKDKQGLNYSAIDADHRNTYSCIICTPLYPLRAGNICLQGIQKLKLSSKWPKTSCRRY